MRTLPAFALILALALMALSASVFAQSTAAPFRIIVHPDNPTTDVERRFLEDAFLKKTTSWPSGKVVRPVDLAPGSAIRRQFTSSVVHRSVAEVKSYWQQRIFSGREVPPPELDTDEEVVTYVLKHEGAVGYVSAAAPLNGSKILTVH